MVTVEVSPPMSGALTPGDSLVHRIYGHGVIQCLSDGDLPSAHVLFDSGEALDVRLGEPDDLLIAEINGSPYRRAPSSGSARGHASDPVPPIVPDTWDEWDGRLRLLMGIPEGADLLDHIGRNGGMLVPSSQELSEVEVRQLADVVAKRLTKSCLETHNCAYAISRLKPADSLPLLFLMRSIAHYWGRTGQYWPAFTRELFNGHVDVGYVRTYLAGPCRAGWVRMYEASHGMLFYPREGPVNIKWPLAHAGLLKEDEDLLRAYGRWLVRSEENPAILWGDVQTFLQDIATWVAGSSAAHSTFGRALCGADEDVALVEAELAQGWLRQHVEELGRDDSGAADDRELRFDRLPSVALQWDSAQEQVGIAVSQTRWTGRRQIQAFLQEARVDIPVTYDVMKEQSRTSPLFIPLQTRSWPTVLRWVVDDVCHDVRLPPSPFTQRGAVLLARVETGRVTHQWEVGDLYFLLGPASLVDSEWARRLFEDLTPAGSPRGDWQGVEVFVGRARNPFKDIPARGRGEDLEALSDALEMAHANFALPGLAEFLRIRTTPVGGRVLPSQSAVSTAYSASDPPLLRVEGASTGPMTLQIDRWDSLHRAYSVVDADLLRHYDEDLLLEPTWPKERTGLYRIRIDGRDAGTFQLIEPEEQSIAPVIVTLAMSHPEVSLSDALDISTLPKDLLEGGTVRVTAWPESRITVLVDTSQGRARRTRWADAAGILEASLADLDVVVPANGPVSMQAYSGCLASNTLTFGLGSGINRASLDLARANDSISFGATTFNTPAGLQFRAVVVGPDPWNGRLWEGEGRTYDGYLEGSVACHATSGWLCIQTPNVDREKLWVVRPFGTPEPTLPSISAAHSAGWTGWALFAGELRRSPLPPGLARLLEFTRSADLTASISGPQACTWIPALPNARSIAAALVEGGFTAPIGVFLRGYPKAGGPAAPLSYAAPITAEQNSADGSWRLSFRGRPMGSRLNAKGMGFVLEVRDDLLACVSCGFVVPTDAWDTHSADGYRRHQTCDTQIWLTPGHSKPVALGMRWHDGVAARAGLEVLVRVLRQGASGEESVTPLLREIGALYQRVQPGVPPEQWLLGIENALRAAEYAGDSGIIGDSRGQAIYVKGLSDAFEVLERHLSWEAVCAC